MEVSAASKMLLACPDERVRVLIAEDHFITRVGIQTIIGAQTDMVVTATAINGVQATSLYRAHRPDICLMDMYMPSDGFDAIAAIKREFLDARIIALSTFASDEDIRRAMNAGACGYLTKDVLQDELTAAIRAVHAGKTYRFDAVEAVRASQSQHPDLSKREIEVLRLIARGFTNKLIAFELGIAEYTSSNHVKNILRKTGTSGRTETVTHALHRGIFRL